MKRPLIIGIFTGLLLLTMTASPAAQKPPSNDSSLPSKSDSTMTLWQARRAMVAGAKFDAYLVGKPWSMAKLDPVSFRFTLDSFEFDAVSSKTGTHHVQVDLRMLESVSAKCSPWHCALKGTERKPLPSPLNELFLHENARSRVFVSAGDERCSADCLAIANSFAAAINHLRAFANDTEGPLRNFTQRAAAWRATNPKPPIPEEVRVQRLLAEDAVKRHNPGEALNRYETGLELYPVWPEGRFNAALIASELGFYAEAVEHMQAYLELVPDAQDAQAARDQIAIWQYKEKGTK